MSYQIPQTHAERQAVVDRANAAQDAMSDSDKLVRYMACHICGAPRRELWWTHGETMGTGLTCSAVTAHGPDVPPARHNGVES